MFINIFSKNKNTNHNNNENFMSDFRIVNNKENEIINNLKQKIFEADSNTKLNKSSDEKISHISKIKLLLQNNNINKKTRKSEGNFTIKNKLNIIKEQINHSNSINSCNKLEKKFTYKLQGNNLIKKNYSKFSNESKKSNLTNNIHKTKSLSKPNFILNKNLSNNSKNNDTKDQNCFSERIIVKKNSILEFEKIINENRIDRANFFKNFNKTLIFDKKNNIHKIEKNIFNEKGLFDSNLKKNKDKKIMTKSFVNSIHNLKDKKLSLPKTLFPNDELTIKDLNKLVHKKEIELKNIHMTIREDLFGEKIKNKKLQLGKYDEQIRLIRRATQFGFFGIIKNKEQFRMLIKREPVYDSLLSNSEEEYNDIYDQGIFYLHPNSLFKKIFDICLILLSLYDISINSFLNAINNGELSNKFKYEIVFNFIIEIFYIIDFIMGFFIGYFNNDEVLITKLELLIINYLENWCFFDFLMSIPFDAILYFCSNHKIYNYSPSHNNESNIYYILTYIRKLKFIKLFSLDGNNFLISFLNEFEFFIFYGNICLYFLTFMILLHNISCIYIIIGKYTYPNWITKLNLNNNEFSKIYICSLYYIISTVTTVGYGDISTYTCIERIFGIILLIAGIMGYSLTLTNISSYINKMNSKTEEYENKMKILDDIKENNSLLSMDLYEKIRRHIKYLNSEKRDKTFILDDLPLTLRNNLLLTMYDPVIKNFVFFKNLHYTDFIIQILLKFKPIIAGYGDILFKDGEFIEEVIFIKNGRVSLNVPTNLYEIYDFNNKNKINDTEDFEASNISKLNFKKIFKKKIKNNNEEKSKKEKEKKYLQILVLRENEHYGIIHIFLNKRSTLCAKIKSKKAELFYLNKNDCLEISQTYTQIWKKINEKSVTNYFQIENLVQKTLQVYYLSKGIKVSHIQPKNKKILNEISDEDSNGSEESSKSYFSNNTIESKNEEENDSHNSQLKNENTKNDEKISISINNISNIFPKENFENKFILSDIEHSKKKHYNEYMNEKEDEFDSESSGMGNYQKYHKNTKKSLSQNFLNIIKYPEFQNSSKTIKMSVYDDAYCKSVPNKNINNLTPFSPDAINDEIYPNEQFVFKENSTNNMNSQNTQSDSNSIINNNNIYNNNNIIYKNNSIYNNNIYNNNIYNSNIYNNNNNKSYNNNLIINNIYSFYFPNSYDNINELANFKYINNILIQNRLEHYIKNSLFISDEIKINQANTLRPRNSSLFFDHENGNNESIEKFLKVKSNYYDKNPKFSILKNSLKKESKKEKKVDFKKLTKKEDIKNIKFYHNFNQLENNNSIKNYSKNNASSFGFNNNDKQKLLDIVNNNIKQNMFMNGGGVISGNNFVEDFLQNQLKISRNHTSAK